MTGQTVVTQQTTHKYNNCMDEVITLVASRVPIIWVITHEENRFIQELYNRLEEDKYKRLVWTWSAYQGLVPYEGKPSIHLADGEEKDTHIAIKALQRITQHTKPEDVSNICYIMRDMQIVLAENITRQIRDIICHLENHGKTLIFVSSHLAHGGGGTQQGVPPTLEKQISIVHYELPTTDNIKNRITEILEQMQSGKRKDSDTILTYKDEDMTTFAKSLQGLTLFEVDNAITTSIAHNKKILVEFLIDAKKGTISKSEILEFIDEGTDLENIGGLDNFKKYIQKYKNAQTDEAKKFGVESLKGIVLVGVPGSGKSLSCKAMGNLFKQPLIRLDIGRVMGSLVGSSESRMRDVIKLLKAARPCICWIDEVEKSLSGTKSSNFSDGGTLSRVFGTLLHAIEEELDDVTIIATSNDISVLPPEFIRRFNEVFFVDLPGPDERWDIFTIHLNKRGRDIKKFLKYKKQLLDTSVDYTGAEIEKAIKESIASAFYAGHKDVNYKDLLRALNNTKPISKVMKDKISKIREKARGNYRYASSWAEQQNMTRKITSCGGKKLDVNKALDDLPEMVKSKKERKKEKNSVEEDRFSNITTPEN